MSLANAAAANDYLQPPRKALSKAGAGVGNHRWQMLALFALAAYGCGAAQSSQMPAEERSSREVELAASLREEGHSAAALNHLRRALELDPDNPRAHLLQGYMAGERGDFGLAERSVVRAIARLKQKGQATLAAEAQNLLGSLYLSQNKVKQAIVVFEESAHSPLNASPHLAFANLGWAYHLEGRRESALSALQKSVEIQPGFCVGYYRIGRVHAQAQEWLKAEENLSLALEVDNRCKAFFQEAWLERGLVRKALKRRTLALGDLERCIEISPRNILGKKCQVHLDALMQVSLIPASATSAHAHAPVARPATHRADP